MAFLERLAGDITTNNTSWQYVVTYTPSVDGIYLVEFHAVARDSTTSDDGVYHVIHPYKRVSGTVTSTATRTVPVEVEDDGTWNANIDTDGTDIRGRVRGDAVNNVDWFVWMHVYGRTT